MFLSVATRKFIFMYVGGISGIADWGAHQISSPKSSDKTGQNCYKRSHFLKRLIHLPYFANFPQMEKTGDHRSGISLRTGLQPAALKEVLWPQGWAWGKDPAAHTLWQGWGWVPVWELSGGKGRLQNKLAGHAFPETFSEHSYVIFFEALFYRAQQSFTCQSSLMRLDE